jgi:hypothetical protein
MIHGLAWLPILCMLGIAVAAVLAMLRHERSRRTRVRGADPEVAAAWTRILERR